MKTKNLFLFIVLAMYQCCFGQIPILNSNALVTDKVIYLDFDGQKVSGTSWNSGGLINAAASTMTSGNIIQIWKRVREDYRPFNVNVTTDSVKFNNAQPNTRIRVVITPTSAWYTTPAGGVAYVGSFSWGGTPGTPCWVFENQLGYSAKNIAEAASHEAGHTLTLRHQSTYTAITCSKTAEYNPGQGTGITSWAPIMGVGYYKNVTLWNFGTSSTSCTTIQYDHGNSGIGITSSGYLSFVTDDVGDIYATGKILNLNNLFTLDSGLISQPTDIDVYKFSICNNRYVSFDVKPWALDTIGYQGANLDIRFALYNASNVLLATDTSLANLKTLVGINLTPGSYYFTIDGGRSSNYPDYGSLGKYFISIKATNPPLLNNTIITSANICAGLSTSLNYTSNGNPTNWQWTVSGTSTTSPFSIASPSVIFNPPGVYTISLLATSPSSLSCITTLTLGVGALPQITVNNPNALFCLPNTITSVLTASGASAYTWMPGSYVGPTLTTVPSITTIYTVTGANVTCTNSAITTVSVNPSFSIVALASNTNICFGGTATITASGAAAYSVNPGGINTNPAVVSPPVSTSYTVYGSQGNCRDKKIVSILVNPDFSPGIISSADTICVGDSVYLTGTTTPIFTVNPGGMVSNPVFLSPITTTDYTITTTNNGTCFKDTVITIATKFCAYVNINKYYSDNELIIYPNPTRSNFTIKTPGNFGKIEIRNALGKIMYSQSITDKKNLEVNAESFSKGIYFVILSNEANRTFVRKVVIQ